MKKVVERALALGLRGEFVPYLPVSLGAVAVNLLDMIRAYSAFARDGSIINPRFILDVKSPWGEDVFNNKPEVKQVISPQTAYIMNSLTPGEARKSENSLGWLMPRGVQMILTGLPSCRARHSMPICTSMVAVRAGSSMV